MGWVIQTKKPCEHKEKPVLPVKVLKSNEHMIGDIWECDDCKAKFKVATYNSKEGMSWDLYDVLKFTWYELPERKYINDCR